MDERVEVVEVMGSDEGVDSIGSLFSVAWFVSTTDFLRGEAGFTSDIAALTVGSDGGAVLVAEPDAAAEGTLDSIDCFLFILVAPVNACFDFDSSIFSGCLGLERVVFFWGVVDLLVVVREAAVVVRGGVAKPAVLLLGLLLLRIDLLLVRGGV